MAGMTVEEQFGQIDIYVFDQILRGNIAPGMTVLDAGCGFGRNLVHLLRQGCRVFAMDVNPEGVEHVRQLADVLGARLPEGNFRVGAIEDLGLLNWGEEFADVVLCNSVLHFARDEDHFVAMVEALWGAVRPGGMLFCRIGSRIGMEFEEVREHVYRIGDDSEWFLVDEEELMDLTEHMGGVLMDPLKTTVVQDHRCMTTWVLRKRQTLDTDEHGKV